MTTVLEMAKSRAGFCVPNKLNWQEFIPIRMREARCADGMRFFNLHVPYVDVTSFSDASEQASGMFNKI